MKFPYASTESRRHHFWVILGIVLVVGALIGSFAIFGYLNHQSSTNESLSVKFEGNYPWLVRGAYADYRSVVIFGSPPWFVVSSGQLLMMAPELPGTPNNPVNGWIPGTGSASLNWTIESRDGNKVLLRVSFNNVGCQDNETAYRIANQSAAPCTYYNFEANVSLMVNLTNDEAYVNGVDQGLLNFWGVPLLEDTTTNSGSVFINQSRFNSVAKAGGPFDSSHILLPLGMQTVNVSGAPYNGPFKIYGLTPTTFGIPNSNYSIGWLNGSITVIGGTIAENPFGPYGYYDFYNGLAYEFSLPQYPIDQTICQYNHGQPSNCELANVSTTLGEFFRSGLGTMLLRSTNIPLSANLQQQSVMPLQPLPLLLISVSAVTFLLLGTCEVCLLISMSATTRFKLCTIGFGETFRKSKSLI